MGAAAPPPGFFYILCHAVNLVLNSASSVPEIRDMFATVKEVTKFLNESAKRRSISGVTWGRRRSFAGEIM